MPKDNNNDNIQEPKTPSVIPLQEPSTPALRRVQ